MLTSNTDKGWLIKHIILRCICKMFKDLTHAGGNIWSLISNSKKVTSHNTQRILCEGEIVHSPHCLHLQLSLCWYPAVPFSCNSFSCVYICFSFFLSLYFNPCLTLNPLIMSSFLSFKSVTTYHWSFISLHTVSASTALQMLPPQFNLFCVYFFPFLFRSYLFLASHCSASAEL